MKRWDHVMIDIETAGTSKTAAITAIGAVLFNIEAGEIGSEFYTLVNLQSSLDAGMTIDGSTFYWWLEQSEAARMALVKGRKESLADALTALRIFIGDMRQTHWGNGQFDLPILTAAFRKVGSGQPWNHWTERDLRTLINIGRDQFGYERPKHEGTHHNALDDARHQAQMVIDIHRLMAADRAPATKTQSRRSRK